MHSATARPDMIESFVKALGSNISSRPVFARLYDTAQKAQLARDFINQIKLPLYIGSGFGIRCSFCQHASDSGQCQQCSLLEASASALYKPRAKEKTGVNLAVSKAIANGDYKSARESCPVQSRHQTLTGMDLIQRNAVTSCENETKERRAKRAKASKERLQDYGKKLREDQQLEKDAAPKLLKLFTEATESGMTSMFSQLTTSTHNAMDQCKGQIFIQRRPNASRESVNTRCLFSSHVATYALT